MQTNVPPERQYGADSHNVVTEPCSAIRAAGRRSLAGDWKTAVMVVYLLFVLIETVRSLIDMFFGSEQVIDLSDYFTGIPAGLDEEITVRQSPVTDLYVIIICGPLSFGVTMFFINLFRKEAHYVSDLFAGFGRFVKTLVLMLYMLLFIILWSAVPVAGIVLGPLAAIRYSQSFYILCDDPGISVPAAVNESKRLMRGNILKYFLLNLSFIGWYLLAFAAVVVIAAIAVTGMQTGALLDDLQFVTMLVELIGFTVIAVPGAYNQAADAAFYDMLTGRCRCRTRIWSDAPVTGGRF